MGTEHSKDEVPVAVLVVEKTEEVSYVDGGSVMSPLAGLSRKSCFVTS